MMDDQNGGDSPEEPAAIDRAGAGAGAEVADARDFLQQSGAADHFYQGVIAWVHWGHERGAIRSVSGREIQFEFPFVTVVGERRSVESLHPGMRVGFDVGQTSGGLRVTMLKVYD
jgi:hypothetical protein